jgi:hypothetical protein
LLMGLDEDGVMEWRGKGKVEKGKGRGRGRAITTCGNEEDDKLCSRMASGVWRKVV